MKRRSFLGAISLVPFIKPDKSTAETVLIDGHPVTFDRCYRHVEYSHGVTVDHATMNDITRTTSNYLRKLWKEDRFWWK